MADHVSMTREQLDDLAKQIADLSLRIDIAKHSLLTALRQFDAHEGFAGSGFVSTAAWLAWRIEIGAVAAREHVRVAKELGKLPIIDAAFAAGKLSYSKVRAITRVATPETEQDLVNVALHATAAQVEKVCAAYRRVRVDPSQPALDQRRYVRRFDTPSGMVRLEMQLPPEQARVVWEAMAAALDAGRHDGASAESGAGAESSDSIGTGAEAEASASAESPSDDVLQAERADAIVNVAQAYLQHRPRTLGSGYELVVMTTKEQLERGPGGVGGYLRDGTPVPLHVARMLACDCTRVDVDISESGEILDVGRTRRTIPSRIGRSLWARDGGCRVPGCGRTRHLQAHHIHAWAEGGKTSTSNLVLLCTTHHTLVHEGQLVVEVHDGKIEFMNAHGLPLRPAPGRSEELEAVMHWLDTAEPDLERDPPLWDGTRLDLHEVLSWTFLADTTPAGGRLDEASV